MYDTVYYEADVYETTETRNLKWFIPSVLSGEHYFNMHLYILSGSFSVILTCYLRYERRALKLHKISFFDNKPIAMII